MNINDFRDEKLLKNVGMVAWQVVVSAVAGGGAPRPGVAAGRRGGPAGGSVLIWIAGWEGKAEDCQEAETKPTKLKNYDTKMSQM